MPTAATTARIATIINEIFFASTLLLRELVDGHEASHAALNASTVVEVEPIRVRLSGSGALNPSVKGTALFE